MGGERACPGAAGARKSARDCRCRRWHARGLLKCAGAAWWPGLSRLRNTLPLRCHGECLRALGAKPTPHLPPLTTTASTAARRDARLAQRAGRQRPAVAEAARAVDHGDFDVAREAVVLQAVVADDDVAFRVCGEQRAGGRGAVGADPDRAARCAAPAGTGSSPQVRGAAVRRHGASWSCAPRRSRG